MRIFIFKKRYIVSIFSIFFLFTVLFYAVSFLQDSPTLAVSLTQDYIVDEDLQSKISALTKSEEKIAYLTFDDGPTLRATPRVLDILKEEDVKATFFVIGKYVKSHPELVKRAYAEGHFIANHGYDHSNQKLYQSEESFINEVTSTDKEIANALGLDDYCSHVFRFPNGFMSPNYHSKKRAAAKLLKDIGYVYVDWNCLNKDSEKKISNYQLLNNFKKTTKNKGTLIILMHDTNDVNDTTAVLKESITYLKEQGYEFRNFYDFVQ